MEHPQKSFSSFAYAILPKPTSFGKQPYSTPSILRNSSTPPRPKITTTSSTPPRPKITTTLSTPLTTTSSTPSRPKIISSLSHSKITTTSSTPLHPKIITTLSSSSRINIQNNTPSVSSSPSQQSVVTSNIIKRYSNINVLKSRQTSDHEEEAVSDNLEGSLRQVEEKNTLLREYNGIFGVEMDKLYEKNKALQERSKKRLKSKERSPDEANDIAGRSEMKHILKGQISDEYALDYDKIFIEYKPPENTPKWAYNAEKIRNEATNIEMLEYGVNDNNDKMTQYDDVSLTDLNLNYLLNSAEMNLIRSEDLDEIGESSQSVS
ncbi:hypothetical protein C1645_814230 [Glomus cerebriforme]|uniref:Uncharacterized protein n=1 Tax=Glomus cerebriforme TaxID=658196 RepID=A0A397TGE8_9GLOM|nr:hypothetical protein C1645_814230 [Glomus cerebriforme]